MFIENLLKIAIFLEFSIIVLNIRKFNKYPHLCWVLTLRKAMIAKYIKDANFEDTGFSYTLSLISGKYKMVILYCLMEYQTVRFNELQRYLKKISDKTLSQNLKELEKDGLVIRTVYPKIPPKVEYSLSERGKSLMVVLDQLCVWGEKNRI